VKEVIIGIHDTGSEPARAPGQSETDCGGETPGQAFLFRAFPAFDANQFSEILSYLKIQEKSLP